MEEAAVFEAQLLIGTGDASGYSVFSPWFPRGGESGRVTLEVVDLFAASTAPTFEVQLFTKNSEESGHGTDSEAGGPTKISVSVAGRTTQEWDSNASSNPATIEELVRYRFTIKEGTEGDWVLFRMLAPVWFDAVTA